MQVLPSSSVYHIYLVCVCVCVCVCVFFLTPQPLLMTSGRRAGQHELFVSSRLRYWRLLSTIVVPKC